MILQVQVSTQLGTLIGVTQISNGVPFSRYTEALQLIGELLRELRKMDDKDLLVEVQLLESKVWVFLF